MTVNFFSRFASTCMDCHGVALVSDLSTIEYHCSSSIGLIKINLLVLQQNINLFDGIKIIYFKHVLLQNFNMLVHYEKKCETCVIVEPYISLI